MLKDIISYRLRNLRSIKDSKDVHIPSLSLLVGQNGSGKSSFMRFFQLLQQSAGISRKAPLLFYGKEVDFGTFEESKCKLSDDDFIEFSFTLATTGPSRYYWRESRWSIPKISVACRLKQHRDSTYLSDVIFGVYDDKISLAFSPGNKVESCIINDENFTNLFENVTAAKSGGFILPKLTVKFQDSSRDFSRTWGDISSIDLESHPLIILCATLAGSRTQKKTLTNIFGTTYGSHEIMLESIKKAIPSETWRKNTVDLSEHDFNYKKIRSSILLCILQDVMLFADEHLYHLSNSIYYIGPARASAQRYYRNQDFDISRIDATGLNVPAFINNLSDSELSEFKEWVQRYFGFKFGKSKYPSHVALQVTDENNLDFNLADVGFGYSQALPILLQLWYLRKSFQRRSHMPRHMRSNVVLFLIEQPELHLHPAFQVKLLRACIDTINDFKQMNEQILLKILIETHSETIVNSLGRAIEDKIISQVDTAIYLFEKESGLCNLQKATFNESGLLENWPFGFFSGD